MSRARTTPSLDDIRREIDAVDTELLNLLEQRFAAVEKIRALKRQSGEDSGTPMRPGREAVILRRLDGLRRGHLPQALMVRVWRSIMSAATSVQAPTTMYVTPVVTADPLLASSVFEQFPGLRVNVVEEAAIPAKMAATTSDIAILPRDGSWLEAFTDGAFGDARVIGCLPLVSPWDRAPDLLVFGHARVETTGADRTIAVLRKKPGHASAFDPLWSQRGGDCTLVCFEGHLEADAPVFAGLAVRIAGHCPSPLEPGK